MDGTEGMQLSCTPYFRVAKYKHGSSQADYYTSCRSTELLKTLIHCWENHQTKFPLCRMNSKLYSKEKRQGFHDVKPN